MKKLLPEYLNPFVSEIDRYYPNHSVRGFLFSTVEGKIVCDSIRKTEGMTVNEYLEEYEYYLIEKENTDKMYSQQKMIIGKRKNVSIPFV